MQDLFAEAVERLMAGEPAAAIVASYPSHVRREIGELLAIVELADDVAVQPVPAPLPRHRQDARAAFLRQAQTLRSEREQALGPAEAAPAPAAAAANWWDQLRAGWRSFFDAPMLRLAPVAPLIAIVIAVYLATFWTVQSAKAALPGDPVYPLKQWVRQQRVTLAPPEQRVDAVREAEEEMAAEARTLATQPIDRNPLALQTTEQMVYYGRRGNLLLFGPFLVAPNFQPDANQDAFVAMRLDDDLEPGSLVELTYRVLPGNPNVVQGVEARVIEAPRPTPPPTAAPTPRTRCRRELPEGWIPYAVRAGDSLASLAAASGAGAGTIASVNCLVDGTLGGVGTIYLPDRMVVRVTPAAMPSPLPTFTPEPSATPEPPFTATPEPLTPAATDLPLTGTPELTIVPPTEQPTEQPTGEVTAEPTGEITPGATETPAETPAETPVSEPSTTPTGEATPGSTPIGTPITQPTGEPTAGPTGEPSAEPTTMPTSELTPELTPAATVAATVEPTTAPTTEPTAQPTSAPTIEPTLEPATLEPATLEPATLEPATATTEPTARPVEPPTREPTAVPTREPPTREPPTREPPTPEPPPELPPPVPTDPPAEPPAELPAPDEPQPTPIPAAEAP